MLNKNSLSIWQWYPFKKKSTVYSRINSRFGFLVSSVMGKEPRRGLVAIKVVFLVRGVVVNLLPARFLQGRTGVNI